MSLCLSDRTLVPTIRPRLAEADFGNCWLDLGLTSIEDDSDVRQEKLAKTCMSQLQVGHSSRLCKAQ
jgi:hypothetical protein